MRRYIAVLGLCLLLAESAHGVGNSLAERWARTLGGTSRQLKNASYAEALRTLDDLSAEMLAVLGPGEETTYVLVVPLIQRAVAEAGMGERASAIWHWQMAQTLYPASAKTDLSMFGEPGAFLKANLLADPAPEACPHSPDEVLPKVAKTVEPIYPEGARQFRSSGIVIVSLRIGADGKPAEPRIVKRLGAPLDYAALQALKGWTFTPPSRDGQPVESNACLTIQFKLTR